MYPHLDVIMATSHRLAHEDGWSLPVRKLAYTVMHGAQLIDRHHLDLQGALPQFERALFYLCHATERPLCGAAICEMRDGAASCARMKGDAS